MRSDGVHRCRRRRRRDITICRRNVAATEEAEVAEAVMDGTVPGVAEASSGGIYPTINRRMTEVDCSPREAVEAETEEAPDEATGACHG